jgi:integrase
VDGYLRTLSKLFKYAQRSRILVRLPNFPEPFGAKARTRNRNGKLAVGTPQLELTEKEEAALLAAFSDRRGFFPEPVVRLHAGPGGIARKPGSAASEADFQRFSASRSFFVLALHSGLDLSDLLALEWSAVDLRSRTIAGHRRKDAEEFLIDLSDQAVAALEQRRKLRGTDGLVFSGFNATTIGRCWRRAKQLAGITRRLRFKDLRHSFASRLVNLGVPLAAVGKALGHADGSRTTARYARISAAAALEMQRKARKAV